jgi:hypothetical protein
MEVTKMNISKHVYILSEDDLKEMLWLAYKDAKNNNSLEVNTIINEVLG